MVSDTVQQLEATPEVRALSTLARVDYADTFVVATGPHDGRTAEDWARLVVEDAPAPMRAALQSGWTGLGLKLDHGGDATTVLGWPIETSTPDRLLLSAGSRIGMPGQLLFQREDETLRFATFVQFGNLAARGVWAGVEPVHVRIVRQLLEHGERRLRA